MKNNKKVINTKNFLDYDEETGEKCLTHVVYYDDGSFDLDMLDG